MKTDRPVSTFVQQFIEVVKDFDDAIKFIREHRIWEGFFRHGWVARLSIIVALIISIQFIYIISTWFSSHPGETTLLQSTAGITHELFESGKNLFVGSGTKYLMLIFLEVLIFHCSVKTLNILLNDDFNPQFKDFVSAEKRMIAVAIRSWIYEMIASVLIGIAVGIIGLSFLKEPLVFVISCYFIGFAFFDNYNEQFKLSLKESGKIIRPYAGAVLAVGLVSYLLMMVPVAGLIVGPIVGSVASALYFYDQGINLTEDKLALRDFVPDLTHQSLKS